MADKSLLFLCYALSLSMFSSHHAMAYFDGFINIDEDDSVPQKEKTVISKQVDSADGEDNDDSDYGSVMSDESGSGSGGKPTTDPNITVDVAVVSPTVTSTTQGDNKITESTSKVTEESVNAITEDSTDGVPTENEDVLGGGVGVRVITTSSHKNVETKGPSKKSPNAEAQNQDRVDKKVLKILTTEVIAAVCVGAVCAVILIAFLVYRLRKRDEGSYALSYGDYKDTYKLQADTGKEAFV